MQSSEAEATFRKGQIQNDVEKARTGMRLSHLSQVEICVVTVGPLWSMSSHKIGNPSSCRDQQKAAVACLPCGLDPWNALV